MNPNTLCMLILRGISGSGKSTVAKMLAHGFNSNSEDGKVSIRSTDDQFMVDGKYCFDQSKLGGYHMKNVWLVEEDCKKNIQCIIVDNTNCKPRDARVYINLAKKYNYSVTIIQVDAGLNEAKKRNNTRSEDRKIPEHVLERQNQDMAKRIDLDKSQDNSEY